MPSPFPGMDPYLETPHLWPDVHHGLISQICPSTIATTPEPPLNTADAAWALLRKQHLH